MKKRSIALFTLALFVAGCGMHRDTIESAKKAANDIADTKKFITEREGAYQKAFENEWKWLIGYANREHWQSKITEAKSEIAQMESMDSAKLQPLLKANKRAQEADAKKLIGQIMNGIGAARELARYPAIRAGDLDHARSSALEMYAKGLDDYKNVAAIAQPLLQYIGGVRSAHPEIDAGIMKRTGVAQTYADQAEKALEAIKVQFARRAAGQDVDYAQFVDSSKLLGGLLPNLKTENDRIRRECAELDQSWSRTLIDMKQRYFVQISQVSWQESENVDFPQETQYVRPWVEVSEKIYDQLDDLPDEQVIATLRTGFFSGGFTAKVSDEILRALSLTSSSATEGFPSWDNEADYELESLRVESYHRYSEEQNGVIKETDWIPVSAEFYDDHYNDLGMSLSAKPYGKFADEIEDDPAPPGMAYVGNPKYGRWQTAGGGTSFWEFYGQYAMLRALIGMSQPGYSRNEWDEYRSYRERGEPYYGGTATAPRYGSSSSTVQTNSRYAETTFAKTGGFQTAQAEIRNAGVNARAGGPGGGREIIANVVMH